MINESVVTIDVHNMTLYQARIAIDAKLRRAKGVYRIRIIHGYHGGTALRDMVRREYAGRVLRIELGLNPGATDLVLREF